MCRRPLGLVAFNPPPLSFLPSQLMAQQPVLVLDGGLSSELEACMAAERSGSDPVLHPTLWSAAELASEPGRARITAVHAAFLEASPDEFPSEITIFLD